MVAVRLSKLTASITRPFHHSSCHAMIEPPSAMRPSCGAQPTWQADACRSRSSTRLSNHSACNPSSSAPISRGSAATLWASMASTS
eukprot:scaffold23088_cov54-Phaeocystis_antarctica.AAC.2